ncbi:hypothetical protein [Ligilactobacillus salivarius]|uniref:Uncharacterized protein n=1 Tax=Ligilactobacillus salivarius TaxID=1624 RepID=A0A9X6S676_9LACO|nr:hypothetical protein [Ligilactobacillus salivarius]OTF89165.1 hypothetical protein A8C38_08435 [Ligilactobacillus salivarius]PAY26346.1 hypothetical protein A8C33_08645 [Ligilactobacillus salivarius]PAY28687.1 hypothetical protein A8C49_08215 [Ligilactobacillus salivarius]PAY31378.1 hypothetical protein A8C44_05080 [Ligilactobacillus salivarius]PAY36745.1 hypothetical protein A8C50_04525 [Ligilactobacillus salivarius]
MENEIKAGLNVVLEDCIKELTSKETSVKGLANDKETVCKLKRAYDTKECIEDLLEIYEFKSELRAMINKYGLAKVFAKLHSDDSDTVDIYLADSFYGWYSDDWKSDVLKDLRFWLPLDKSEL